jgi:opacity protein-like surface antigen
MMRKVAALTLVVLLAAGTCLAGGSKMGTAGAQELRIPVGARGTGMAGAVVADVTGSEALFWNPAGAAWSEGTDAFISYRGYIADMDVSYFSVLSTFGYGSIGVSAKILSLGDIYVTTEDDWDGTGEVFSVNIPVLGITYSRMLTDKVAFGATGMYINEQVMETSARGVAFDFGFQYVPGWKTLKMGMVMKSYGPRLEFSGADLEKSILDPNDDPQAAYRTWSLTSANFELPSSFQIGLSYDFDLAENGKATTCFTFQSNNFSQDEYRLGAEYNLHDKLYIRAGYVYCDQEEYLYGPSLGVGTRFKLGRVRTQLDYSHSFVDNYFDDIPEISFKFGV